MYCCLRRLRTARRPVVTRSPHPHRQVPLARLLLALRRQRYVPAVLAGCRVPVHRRFRADYGRPPAEADGDGVHVQRQSGRDGDAVPTRVVAADPHVSIPVVPTAQHASEERGVARGDVLGQVLVAMPGGPQDEPPEQQSPRLAVQDDVTMPLGRG